MRPKKAKTVNVTLKMTPEDAANVGWYADLWGVSKSDVIRESVTYATTMSCAGGVTYNQASHAGKLQPVPYPWSDTPMPTKTGTPVLKPDGTPLDRLPDEKVEPK